MEEIFITDMLWNIGRITHKKCGIWFPKNETEESKDLKVTFQGSQVIRYGTQLDNHEYKQGKIIRDLSRRSRDFLKQKLGEAKVKNDYKAQ